MRIVGYIEHDVCKITIMHMNHRYAVKFENEGIEQTYKIRASETITNVEDIKALFTKDIIDQIIDQFTDMEKIRLSIISSSISEIDDFEEII